MNRADRKLLEAVASDLKFLDEEWNPDVDEQSVRRTSTVLRNLLVEGALGRAWRLLGERGEPEVEAVDLAHALAGLETGKIAFAAAGGGASGKMQVAGALIYREAMPESTIRERAKPEPPKRKFRLSAFLAAPGIVVDGQTIKRREIIQYVANKLGGAHFDARRTKAEIAFQLLDRAIDVFHVAERPVVYFELLSIGQTLADSPDAKKLRSSIESLG